MAEFIDNVGSVRTGTGLWETTTEFIVPRVAKRIIGLEPYTLLTCDTAGEVITVRYRLMRGMVNLVIFESDPITSQEAHAHLMEGGYSRYLHPKSDYRVRYIYVDIPVTGNEKLTLVRSNNDYYTCSPIAGLSIKYSSQD